MGDRFGHQGEAQLRAVIEAEALGISVTPVWNKSNREHNIIGSEPASVRAEADAAVAALGWRSPYYIDADHVGFGTVDRFLASSNFYTIDVADFVARESEPAEVAKFVQEHRQRVDALRLKGVILPDTDGDVIEGAAHKFLAAMHEAGRIYRHIAAMKGDAFIVEVSVDETDTPQTSAELLLILAMLAREGIPVQTIAPKFTGRFNKGVDYAGDLARFEKEFDEDLAVVRLAIQAFGLPPSLKLSVHSGSDKFSLYPVINRLLKKHGAGLHLKTAGTTWLEEVIGLAEAGGEGLQIAREIYATAHARFDELAKPYAAVIDIDRARLPSPAEVLKWDSARYVAALRHEPSRPGYNPHFRQLIHIAFKVAAEMGPRYTDALKANREIIARNVTTNLLKRHLKPLFG